MALRVNNPPKLFGIIVAMIIIGVLMGVGAVDQLSGVPLLTMLVGYLVGNGVAATRGDPVEPIIGLERRIKSGKGNSTEKDYQDGYQ